MDEELWMYVLFFCWDNLRDFLIDIFHSFFGIQLQMQVAKRKMEMLFVRGDGVILVRFFLFYLFPSLLYWLVISNRKKGITTIENIINLFWETARYYFFLPPPWFFPFFMKAKIRIHYAIFNFLRVGDEWPLSRLVFKRRIYRDYIDDLGSSKHA